MLLLLTLLSPLAMAQERPGVYAKTASMAAASTQAEKILPEAPRPKPYQFDRKVFIAGVSILAASNIADAITTRQMLNRGGWENNPAFGRHPSPAKQAGINLAFFAGESALFYVTEHNRHAWVRWTGRVFLAHAIEEHSRLAACNAGINPGAPTIQKCKAYPGY